MDGARILLFYRKDLYVCINKRNRVEWCNSRGNCEGYKFAKNMPAWPANDAIQKDGEFNYSEDGRNQIESQSIICYS